MDKTNTLCPAPWMARMIQSTKNITPCCYTREENIDLLKQQFLAGNKPKQCQYCWDCEDNDLHSPRQDFIKFAGTPFNDQIEMITLHLGNYCNAECIICSGDVSSKRNNWAKKYNTVEFKKSTISDGNVNTIDFNLYPNLKLLTLLGGEPIIHPDTKSILSKIIKLGIAKNIDIGINTNASMFDNEINQMLKQFKKIFVTLSIDGAGSYFEYQRRPLKWDVVKEIANQWLEFSNHIIINYVVTSVSIWGFNDFIHWYDNLPPSILSKSFQLKFTHVVDKPYLTLRAMPDKQKALWINQAVEHKFKKQMLNILRDSPFDSKLLVEFSNQIVLEDIVSPIKFSELCPNWNLNE